MGGTLTGAPIPGVGVQKAILRTASGGMGDLTMGGLALYQAQDEVAVAWSGEVRAWGGGRTPVNGISLFAFDEEARIRLCRVYWNPRPLTGTGPDDASCVDAAHREAIHRYYLAFNARDWIAIGKLFAEEGSFGGTLAGPGLRGEATLKGVYEAAVTRFPGILMRPGQAYQAQDEVAVHWEGEAGSWDGRRLPIRGIALFRFDGEGRILRYRIYWDPRELLPEA